MTNGEYTVKEHLKRIMQKTKTTTRTGLLARMVFPTTGNNGSRSFLNSAGVDDTGLLPPVQLKTKMASAIS